MRTDKYNTGLFKSYEKLFLPYKEKRISFLEVGVSYGDSLMWAKSYFDKAIIYGIDIEIPVEVPKDCLFSQINQNDTTKIIEFAQKHGPFDIIIDDASHLPKETRNTFNNLFPYLIDDGLYIIEDWGAGLMPEYQWAKGLEQTVIDIVFKNHGEIVKNEKGGCFAVVRPKKAP